MAFVSVRTFPPANDDCTAVDFRNWFASPEFCHLSGHLLWQISNLSTFHNDGYSVCIERVAGFRYEQGINIDIACFFGFLAASQFQQRRLKLSSTHYNFCVTTTRL